VGYAIARAIFPPRAFSPLEGGWLYLLASLVAIAPVGLLGLVGRHFRRDLVAEFHRQLEA
jgi:hypothetical protein